MWAAPSFESGHNVHFHRLEHIITSSCDFVFDFEFHGSAEQNKDGALKIYVSDQNKTRRFVQSSSVCRYLT
jgi:hypothetical protein